MAKEIMDLLREMFGPPSWSLRHKAIKHVYTKQMKEGTSVSEHVLDMMIHFNIAEVNSGPINEANQKKGKGKTPKNRKGKNVAKGKCYLCNQNGHWLRNCPKYLAKKKAKKEAQGGIILKVWNMKGCLG
ncbi:gag/pol protein [Cucumis melo var. makuwa]|uniref:Gag/pol protein n=1 Tax=Cucumis melo var. makuwa TaxID=1194695 RepID=A0A5D3CWV1_CUCMM|nr:gag/pol protein [Cucumis melo var. makuwa]